MGDPLDEAKEILDLREDLQKKTKNRVFQVFPKKIAELQRALQSEMFDTRDLSVIHAELPPALLNGSERLPAGKDGPSATSKKRKLEEQGAEGFPAVPPKRPAHFSGIVPGNAKLEAIVDFIKPEIQALVDSCNLLKMWIQMRIPRIEDGNNFGVNIQEDVLGEVSKAEVDAGNYLDQISRYFNGRAKLISKVAKYPQLADYRRAVNEYDEKVFFCFKITVTEVRNIYAVLYDMVIKNYEKLSKPRSSNAQSMY